MSGNFIYILCAITVVAFSSFAMYGGEMARTSKFALGIILLSALSIPFVGAVKDFHFSGFSCDDGEYSSSLTEEVAKDAFIRGIKIAVLEKFYLSDEEISIACEGFDFENMRAERITIFLSGKAVYSDGRSIREYVKKTCDCEVSIEFG